MTFVFDAFRFDEKTGEAVFTYAFDDTLRFTERLQFPLPSTGVSSESREALERALFTLHLALGVSYFKAYCPERIEIRSGVLSETEAAFWSSVYQNGLAEFFYRNGMEIGTLINFPVADANRAHGQTFLRSLMNSSRLTAGSGFAGLKQHSFPTEHVSVGTIVPIGGGKDSILTAELLQERGQAFVAFVFGEHANIRAVVQAIGVPLLEVKRTIDPLLFELNAKGALNGHVPLSSILACASTVVAILHGQRDIIVSNERSASDPNTVVNGRAVNHQWSKSLVFEHAFQMYLRDTITPNVRYFSLVRPLSELRIIQEVCRRGKYLEVISSCNRAFRRDAGNAPRWCGECPKCAFAFACFAAFLPRERMVQMFGSNLFDRVDLIPLYAQLVGIEGIKPFDCVGDAEETRAAFVLALARGEWSDALVMRWFMENVRSLISDDVGLVARVLAPGEDHAIPEDYQWIYETL